MPNRVVPLTSVDVVPCDAKRRLTRYERLAGRYGRESTVICGVASKYVIDGKRHLCAAHARVHALNMLLYEEQK